MNGIRNHTALRSGGKRASERASERVVLVIPHSEPNRARRRRYVRRLVR